MKKALTVAGIIIGVILVFILITLQVIKFRMASGANKTPVVVLPENATVINIFEGSLDLRNIVLANPPGFKERVFVSVPEIFVAADTATLSGAGVKRFREIHVNIAEVVAIRGKNRKYNFESMLHRRTTQAGKPKMKISIGRLRVQFGHIVFMDYTVRGGKPLLIRFDVNMDEKYENVSDLDELSRKVTKTFLKKITIGDIKNYEVKDLPDISRSALAAIPDETKDKVFGKDKDRDRVLKELADRFSNKIKGK